MVTGQLYENYPASFFEAYTMSKFLFPILILTILAAGCATSPTAMTPAASLAAPRTPNETTATPQPAHTPAQTSAQTDTPTPAPTSTPTATATEPATATPEPTNAPTATSTPGPQVRAQGKDVNVRRGPGTLFPVMALLPDGETARIVARGPNGWLQIKLSGKLGWIYSGVVDVLGPVETLPMAENIPTPPPTLTPLPPTATPAPAGPQLPPKQATVRLTQDAHFPLRANRFIGWGYEIVDASDRWDIVLNRDVFGYVLHEFYGDALYKNHPRGMRVTFIDCVPKTFADGYVSPCLGAEPPLALFGDKRTLTFSFGDGAGSVIATGCAAPAVNYYDPQECFVALGPADGGYLTDVVIASMTVADAGRLGYRHDANPDFRTPPFTPNLGVAVRDDALQQWRWKDPFLQITPQQP